jgi:hypothetical protein
MYKKLEYKDGGLVKGPTYRENTPGGVKIRKGKAEERVNTPSGVVQRPNPGTKAREKRAKTNSNRRK